VRITEIDHELDFSCLDPPGYVRTPGLHMSDIYKSLYAELDPARFGGEGAPDPLRMGIGSAFEPILEREIGNRLLGSERPGEFTTKEGVIYTPDHLLFNCRTRLAEFKVSWMSDREGVMVPRFDHWFTQMKVYAHHLQMPHARLYALFINGDYRPPAPRLRAWDIEFTKREMADEWAMLLRHARDKGML
jgi:hypothetical protein